MGWWERFWRVVGGRPDVKAAATAKTVPKSFEPGPSRRVHLGIDFGTCWSKIVLRDYEANTRRAFVVRVLHREEKGGAYRIPSSVTLSGGTLHFGWSGLAMAVKKGSIAFHSVKMRAAFPDAPEHAELSKLPEGFTASDLAALVVAHLIQVGSEAAIQYVGSLSKRSLAPRIGTTIGVPMGLGQDPRLRDTFVEIARVGLDLYHNDVPSFGDGLDLSRARQLLDESRRRLDAKGPVQDPREWVRSEAEAGLLWIFESPRVPSGLYICVDVGAGTTDVSVFQIAEQLEEGSWVKGKLAFYSAVSSRPGVDAVDEVIVKALSDSGKDVRSIENELIQQHGLEENAALRAVLQRIFEVYQEAWRQGYKKLTERKVWQQFGLFVLGGGSKINPVLNAITKTPWPGSLADRVPKQNEFPRDLFEMPRSNRELSPFNGDGAFLLVAYGLSFMRGDVPPVETPDEMPPYEPPRLPRRSIDQDEYYPK